VLIPEAVQRECLAKSGEDSQRIQQAIDCKQLQVMPMGEVAPSIALPRSLGDGEKEAICLAIQHENSLLIVDDQLARRQAAKLGLTFIGLVRLLAIAEQQGLIGW
jgi:predicted nucleic acid-binding protein